MRNPADIAFDHPHGEKAGYPLPHSSTKNPETALSKIPVPRDKVREEAAISAELYTDVLAAAAWPDSEHVIAPVSRIVVHVER